jgi:hypothetical protein
MMKECFWTRPTGAGLSKDGFKGGFPFGTMREDRGRNDELRKIEHRCWESQDVGGSQSTSFKGGKEKLE